MKNWWLLSVLYCTGYLKTIYVTLWRQTEFSQNRPMYVLNRINYKFNLDDTSLIIRCIYCTDTELTRKMFGSSAVVALPNVRQHLQLFTLSLDKWPAYSFMDSHNNKTCQTKCLANILEIGYDWLWHTLLYLD